MEHLYYPQSVDFEYDDAPDPKRPAKRPAARSAARSRKGEGAFAPQIPRAPQTGLPRAGDAPQRAPAPQIPSSTQAGPVPQAWAAPAPSGYPHPVPGMPLQAAYPVPPGTAYPAPGAAFYPAANQPAPPPPPVHLYGVARPVEILRGLRDIAAFLRVKQEAVLDMEKQGAPIFRYNGMLRAEKAELWEWLKHAG